MSRDKPIDRRTALKGLGASTVALAQVGSGGVLSWAHHPLVPQTGAAWAPRFLTDAEVETVRVLSEIIIPATDTPGAEAAKVFQYIDWILSEGSATAATPEDQRSFRSGLAWLEKEARERHQAGFAELDRARQESMLTELATPGPDAPAEGVAFFEDIKQRTVEGYYRSEIGMMEELGFQGNTILGDFKGCTHPEHLSFEPAGESNPPPPGGDEEP